MRLRSGGRNTPGNNVSQRASLSSVRISSSIIAPVTTSAARTTLSMLHAGSGVDTTSVRQYGHMKRTAKAVLRQSSQMMHPEYLIRYRRTARNIDH